MDVTITFGTTNAIKPMIVFAVTVHISQRVILPIVLDIYHFPPHLIK